MYASWGLVNGQFTPFSLAGLALRYGFRAVAMQFDFRDDQGRTAAPVWPAFESAMRGAGIMPGVWFTDGWMLPFAPPSADFVVAEIEGPNDYDGVVDSIHQLNPGQKHAVITNFGGLLVQLPEGEVDVQASKARCKPLVDAGFFCQYEAYEYTQPDNSSAEHCGWPGTMVAPVLGVGFNGRSLDSQGVLQVPGYGLYLAEYLS